MLLQEARIEVGLLLNKLKLTPLVVNSSTYI